MMNRGFTLIESLIYLALFALIIGGLVSSAYFLFENSDRNQTKAMLQEERDFLLGKINWALMNASSATVSGSTLTVTKYSGSQTKVCLSGTDMKYLEGSGTCTTSGTVLNNSNVSVTGLSFAVTGSTAIRVETVLTVSAKTPNGLIVSQTATSTRYLRK